MYGNAVMLYCNDCESVALELCQNCHEVWHARACGWHSAKSKAWCGGCCALRKYELPDCRHAADYLCNVHAREFAALGGCRGRMRIKEGLGKGKGMGEGEGMCKGMGKGECMDKGKGMGKGCNEDDKCCCWECMHKGMGEGMGKGKGMDDGGEDVAPRVRNQSAPRVRNHRQLLARRVRIAVASARQKGTWRRLRVKTQVHKPSPPKIREAKQTQAVHLGVEQINAAVDELRAEKDAYTQAAQRERSYEDAIVHMNNSTAGNMMWTHLPEETREAIRARLGREGKILRLHVV